MSIGAAVALVVVVIGAVVLLGTDERPKFSAFDSNINVAPPASTTTTTRRPAATTTTRERADAPPSTLSAAETATWVPWTAPDGTFSLAFPEPPFLRQDPPEDGVTYSLAMADGASAYVLLEWVDVPPGVLTDPRIELREAVIAYAHNSETRIDSQTEGTFAGHPSRTFTGSMESRDVKGVYFLVGNRAYGLIVVAPDSAAPIFDHAASTFRLT